MIKLFHISFKSDLEGIWEPVIPAGNDQKTTSDYPEPDIPRISCSPTVEQCFQAIYPNVSKYFEEFKYPYMEFYVYSPELKGTEKIWTPDYLTKNKLVHDAHVTQEHCLLESVFMKLVKKIKIMNTNKSKDLMYKPFNDESLPEKYLAPKTIVTKNIPIRTNLKKW
ncbi:hypothetical protein [Flavobacterium sp.]|jgi:hypothetical protein|uniref:hypothetical protein n=1 Tax=Flavobacterium sp. TaxID=239 RepID=UPI0037BEF93C